MTTWVLFAGLPGTGKSTLARLLSQRMSAAILDKDVVRAALFPGPLTDYSAEQDDLCVRAMVQAATYLTVRQQVAWIFFDGRTFSSAAQVDQVLEPAEQAGAGWRILHLVCEDKVAEQRLAGNAMEHPAKNRDLDLYRAIQQRFEPIVRPHLAVNTTHGVEGQIAVIEQYLAARGAGNVR